MKFSTRKKKRFDFDVIRTRNFLISSETLLPLRHEVIDLNLGKCYHIFLIIVSDQKSY